MNPSPFSKQAQVERGTPPERRKKQKEKSAAVIGKEGEIQAGEALCEVLGKNKKSFRRNRQGILGGGLNNSDLTVKGLDGWAIEIKTTQTLQVPLWWRTLTNENSKRPMLVMTVEGQRLALVRVADLANLAQDVIEAHGLDIVPST